MKKILKLSYTLILPTLILLLILEIGLGFFYNYHGESGIDDNTERIIASGAYDELDPTTVKEIFRELRQQDMKWKSYVHYSFKPFEGKHNTIYANGQRKTENFSLKNSKNALKIFCFGGSTMYSSGARDEHTIPSKLSKLIHDKFPNQNIEITNFGCHGYTRTSENIQLQQELIKNNIPDIVIFYDGVNEIISAHQNNRAGTPTNAYNRINEFKIAHDYKKRIRLVITSSNLYRFTTALQRKINTNSAYGKLQNRPDSLGLSIAKNYIGLVKISNSLEKDYGFKTYNFIQPIIYSKKHLSPTEKEYYKYQEYYENLYRISYNAIKNDSLMINDPSLIDISNAFDTTKKTIYVDFCHVSELGNELVAKKIFNSIEKEFSKEEEEEEEEVEN